MSDRRARTPGRPRGFDEDAALDAAMGLFWEQGYAETSIAQLRDVTGLSNASLSNAFGSKEQMFARVVERYTASYGAATDAATDDTLSPRDALERALRQSAAMQTDPTHPAGCLLALSAAVCAPNNLGAVELVAAGRKATRDKLAAAINRAVGSGELPEETDTSALVTMFHSFLLGLSIEARDGARDADLQAAIDQIMRVWERCASTRTM